MAIRSHFIAGLLGTVIAMLIVASAQVNFASPQFYIFVLAVSGIVAVVGLIYQMPFVAPALGAFVGVILASMLLAGSVGLTGTTVILALATALAVAVIHTLIGFAGV